MKTMDLKHLANEHVIEAKLEGDALLELNTNDELLIYQIDGEYIVEQNDNLSAVINSFVFTSLGNIKHYIWIPVSISGNTLSLQYIPCLPSNLGFENLDAAIDDKIVHQVVEKANLADSSVESIGKWMHEQFVLQSSKGASLLLSMNRKNKKKSGSLTLVGRQYLLQVEIKPDGMLWVNTLTPKPRNRNYDLTHLNAEISFVDSTLASRIQDSSLKEKLDELEKTNTAYIQLWDEYNQKVKEKAVQLAKEARFVRFVKCQAYESIDGVEWRFYFKEKDKESVEALCGIVDDQKDNLLEVSQSLPEWLDNDGTTDLVANDDEHPSIKAQLVRKSNQYLVLELQGFGKPNDQGVIYLSISGSLVQMRRREKARDAITRLTNPMPELRFLIENLDFDSGRSKYKTLKPLTQSARAAFKGTPTRKQVQALDVALNTPDIALILGPPGTGKTQVISALQNRLAEAADQSMTAEILLTSFQNDAVDNVVARSEAFGIPAIRADDNVRAPLLLEQWVKKQAHQLGERVESVSHSDGAYKILKNINADIVALHSKTVDFTIKKARLTSLLEDVNLLRIEHGFEVPLQLVLQLEECLSKTSTVASETKSERLLQSIRGLRTTKTSYNDDGSEQCWRCGSALRRLDSYRGSEEVDFLEALSDSFEPISDSQLTKLRSLKNDLLDHFLPDIRPKVLQSQMSDQLTVLLNQLAEIMHEHASSCSAGIPEVLEEYLETIKYQPHLLASCVSEYTTSVGASCQRSQSEKVSSYKQSVSASLGEVNSDISFDTVIVDEAARANPLDLFIPMALAKRRIVLVGDHFQLPQMLEPDIEKEMTETGSLREETADAIKKSLFERLYMQLKQREAKDGIKRTVMLDTQFRMHPKIGDFVSRSFYESEGEAKVNAGLTADRFDLGIANYSGKFAEWIDVPLSSGKELRSGTSWQRRCEAERIAEEIADLLEASTGISIGVITFFAAQRELIFDQLAKRSICRKTSDGWEYLPEYKNLPNGEERLRVGSVDAFQGKEFDVVLLSMVRSNNYSATDENSLRAKYGFIRTPNRLNVAFSRAKSLIKVIGDKAMFDTDEAKKAIPPVWSFVNELCEEQ
ncbi:DEAD/DEAH box helicase [Vibrio sp. 1F255]|uniref:DEAD/DEAH box helicase n=1 Tax=Vibrio sp. 1F255 TaxID=3230009 RepID=UPI00352DE2AB